jgi:hypothetical protein
MMHERDFCWAAPAGIEVCDAVPLDDVTDDRHFSDSFIMTGWNA